MSPSIVDEDILVLDLNKTITDKLKNNNLKTICDVWMLKRKELKEKNFTDSEIKSIIISLQLHGLDLNKKVYH